MHAPLVCLWAAILAAAPGDASAASDALSGPFAAAIRGQSPTFDDPSMFVSPAPADGTVMTAQAYPAAPYGGYEGGIIYEAPAYPAAPAAPMYAPTPMMAPPPMAGYPPVFADELLDPGGFYVGYESVIVKPYFTSDAAFTRVEPAGNAVTLRTQDFDWDLEHSPRVWIGVAEPGGLGFQARYWQFDHENEEAATDTGAGFLIPAGTTFIGTDNGDVLTAQRGLELHSLDLEGVWRRNLMAAFLSVTAGFRYARLDQTYTSQIIESDGDLLGGFHSRNDFEGFGPTISLLGRRRIGSSNFALFATGRGSLLFGERSIQQFDPTADLFFEPVGFSNEGDTLMPVTEMQAGIEWWTRTGILSNARLFLRAALEGQVWWDAGTAAPRNLAASPDEGNLGFFGGAFGGGLTY